MEVVRTLQTNIDLYQDMDPRYLPQLLCMLELADCSDKSAKARAQQYDCPWAHRLQDGYNWYETSLFPEPHIQGYRPMAFCMDMGGPGYDYHEDGTRCGQRLSPTDALALHG